VEDTASSTEDVPDEAPDTATGVIALVGGRLLGAEGVDDGDVAPLIVAAGKIVQVGGEVPVGAEEVDVSGRWVAPAFIDSHVHILYRPRAAEMLAGGVAGVVDHAAPERIFEPAQRGTGDLEVVASGPMVTAVGGYPTQSWGSNGYGLECADAEAATAAVAHLAERGAGFIKIPFTGGSQLDDDAVRAAVAEAHRRGLRVSVHALTDAAAARAGRLGADVLAHTPVEALSEETLALWADRAVVSTLDAFGGSDATVDNLRALRARGARVLYGTDYGNTVVSGVDPREVALLVAAGLDGDAILRAGTRDAADFWGFDDLGALAVGRAASFMLLTEDPRETPSTLGSPAGVWIRGAPVED